MSMNNTRGDYFPWRDPEDTVYQAIRNVQARGVSTSLCLCLVSRA